MKNKKQFYIERARKGGLEILRLRGIKHFSYLGKLSGKKRKKVASLPKESEK